MAEANRISEKQIGIAALAVDILVALSPFDEIKIKEVTNPMIASIKIGELYGFRWTISNGPTVWVLLLIAMLLYTMLAVHLIKNYTAESSEERLSANFTAMFLSSPLLAAFAFFSFFKNAMPGVEFIAVVICVAVILWAAYEAFCMGIRLLWCLN